MVEADMVEGPVEGVIDEEVMEAMNKMKLGKAAGPSEVNMDMIIASGSNKDSLSEDWKASVAFPISKGKRYVMDCGAYRGVKLLEHAMKIVERVVENRIRELVTMDYMQFGFMPGKGTTHALFILRRMQEEFRKRKQKL